MPSNPRPLHDDGTAFEAPQTWTRRLITLFGAGLFASGAVKARAEEGGSRPSKGAKSRYRYVVFTDCKPGKEEAFNDWYTNRHIHDLVAIPGGTAAQRFERSDLAGKPLTARYLAIYEMEAEDPKTIMAEIRTRAGTSRMPISPDLDPGKSTAQLFKVLSDRVTAA